MGSSLSSPANASAFVGCRVYHNANQSFNAGAGTTALAFNSEYFDSDGFHDNTTNNSRLTIPSTKGGKYLAGAIVDFAVTAGGTLRNFGIRLNGTNFIAYVQVNSIGGGPQTTATIYDLAVGDYLEVVPYTDTATAITVNRVADYTPIFWLTKIG